MASLASALLDLALAPICLGCACAITPRDPDRPVCGRCRSMLAPPPPPVCMRCGAPRLRTGRDEGPPCPLCHDWTPLLRYARSACTYDAPATTLVRALKYDGWSVVAPVLAERMAAVPLPAEVVAEAHHCVPVPTTSARRRQRGYDQAHLLASELARRTGRTVLQALARHGAAGTQTALQPLARGANVAGGFRFDASYADRLGGAHVLLVDDVLTTGATAIECARTLADAGVRCTSLITFARALAGRPRT